MNGIKIFGENFVNADCVFSSSYGADTLKYLYDQNPDTKFTANVSTQELVVKFYDWQGAWVPKTFDRILLLNTTFGEIEIDSWNGTTWDNISEGSMYITEANKIIEFVTPIVSNSIRITCYASQTGHGTVKSLGELKVCQSIFNGAQLWRSDVRRSDEQKAGSYRTGDGVLVAWKEWAKFSAACNLYDVAKADYDLLAPCLKSSAFYTVLLWDDFDMTDCYEVAFVDAASVSLDRKTQLYEVYFKMMGR